MPQTERGPPDLNFLHHNGNNLLKGSAAVNGLENSDMGAILLEQDSHGAVGGTAILLIDDNAVQAATRQTILKRAGYQVFALLDPVRALAQIQMGDFPAEIKLVITDHLMPKMMGAEFVRELRKSHPDLPVLVISGLEEAEDEYDGLDVLFRMKPLLPDHLLASVHRLTSVPPARRQA